MAGHYIPNSRIAVDIWEEVPERKIHFLTHFHETQMAGLTSKWKRGVYTSRVTARYLEHIVKIKPRFVKVLEVNKTYTILHKGSQESFSVTVLWAHHCSGSIMFLFEGNFGRVLYTGHCRYKPSMLKNPVLARTVANQNLDVMFLDNTYAAPECKFPSDVECMKQVVEIIRANPNRKILLAMLEEDESQALRCLVKVLKEKIVINKQKNNITQKLLEEECRSLFTDDPSQSLIHAVDLSEVTVERDKDKSLVAILLTLEYQFGDRKFDSAADTDVYIIPYSTHSSYCELASFVSQIRPKQIVPVVAETSSMYSVIPKQLHDLCRVSPNNPISEKLLELAQPVSAVQVLESTKKIRGMRSPRINLSLSNSHVRSESGCNGSKGGMVSCINGVQQCNSRGEVALEKPASGRENDESSERIIVSCSGSSCEIQSRCPEILNDGKCVDGPLQDAGHKSSSPLLSQNSNATPGDMPDESTRPANPDHEPTQPTSADALGSAIDVKYKVRVIDDDELSILTVSPGTVEMNDNDLFGITLHQSFVDSRKTSSQSKYVSCGVQTDSVHETNIHQFSGDEELEFLPSVHILPEELKRKMRLRLCECDVCMAANKMKHLKMFPRWTESAAVVEESGADELEPPCLLFVSNEGESVSIPVAAETVTKHVQKNKTVSDRNVGEHGEASAQAVDAGESGDNLHDSLHTDAASPTVPFAIKSSRCVAENMQENFSHAVQKLNNNCWVSEYEVAGSVCTCSNDFGACRKKLVPGKTSDAQSNDKTNTEEDMMRNCVQLNNTSSQHVTVARESAHVNRNQDTVSCQSLSSPFLPCNKIPAAHTLCKPGEANVNATLPQQLQFLNYLNLKNVQDNDSNKKPNENYSEKLAKLNQSHLNKSASDVAVPVSKNNFIPNTTSSIRNSRMHHSQQRGKQLSLHGSKDLNRVLLTMDCALELCSKKSLRVTLTRLKPEQISGYSCATMQKKTEHEKSKSTIDKPGDASRDSQDAFHPKDDGISPEGRKDRSGCKKNLVPYFDQVQLEQHDVSREEIFLTASSGSTRTLTNNNSSEIFYSALSTSISDSQLSDVNMLSKKSNNSTTSDLLSSKRKWDNANDDSKISKRMKMSNTKNNFSAKEISSKDSNEENLNYNTTYAASVAARNTGKRLSEEQVNANSCMEEDASSGSEFRKDQNGNCSSVHKFTCFDKNNGNCNKCVTVQEVSEASCTRVQKNHSETSKMGTLLSDGAQVQILCNKNDRSSNDTFPDKSDESSGEDITKINHKRSNSRNLEAGNNDSNLSKQCKGMMIKSAEIDSLMFKDGLSPTRGASQVSTCHGMKGFSEDSSDKSNVREGGRKCREIKAKKVNQSVISTDDFDCSLPSTLDVRTKMFEDLRESSDENNIFEMVRKVGRARRLGSQQPEKFYAGGASKQGKHFFRFKNKGSNDKYDEVDTSVVSTVRSKGHVKNVNHDDSSGSDDCIVMFDTKQDKCLSSSNMYYLRDKEKCSSTSLCSKTQELCMETGNLSTSVSSESDFDTDFFVKSPSRYTRLRRRVVSSRMCKNKSTDQDEFYEL